MSAHDQGLNLRFIQDSRSLGETCRDNQVTGVLRVVDWGGFVCFEVCFTVHLADVRLIWPGMVEDLQGRSELVSAAGLGGHR